MVAHTSDGMVADPITTTEGKSWTNEGTTFRLRNCVQQPYAKSKRAQSASDDETWKPGEVSPTLNHFDVGDTRATTVVAFTQNQREEVRDLGDVSATVKSPGTHEATYIAEAFSVREDAKAGNFSATPTDVGLAVQAHQPSVQSHHAQIFVAQQQPMAFSCKDSGGDVSEGVAPTLRSMNNQSSNANAGGQLAVAVGTDCYNGAITGEVAATIGTPGSSVNASGPTVMEAAGFSHSADGGSNGIAWTPEGSPPIRGGGGGNTMPAVMHQMAVRRLTPRECERLQGFPDDYTLIPWRKKPAEDCPDGPRYRALGNSMAVPVMRWIGERIAMVDAIEPSADAQNSKHFEGPRDAARQDPHQGNST